MRQASGTSSASKGALLTCCTPGTPQNHSDMAAPDCANTASWCLWCSPSLVLIPFSLILQVAPSQQTFSTSNCAQSPLPFSSLASGEMHTTWPGKVVSWPDALEAIQQLPNAMRSTSSSNVQDAVMMLGREKSA